MIENTDKSIQDMDFDEMAKQIINSRTNVTVDVEDDTRAKDILEDKIAKDIICSYASKNNADSTTAMIAITKFVQDGGTNISRPNMTRKINGVTYELSDLRQIIRLHDKFGTVRKLAKTIRKIIAAIAKVNLWKGPLYKDLQRLNPALIISEEDAVYCSEFNSDNYDQEMPPKIREALQQREQKIRENRERFAIPKNTKGKQGKRKRGRTK